MRRYLEDLLLHEEIDCGSFVLSRAEIVEFAEKYDPQPWHLDDDLAAASAFGELVASGVHTQAMAVGLLVRRLADVAVLFGGSLHEARFAVPMRPDTRYTVTARWTEVRESASNVSRGVAKIAGAAAGPDGRVAMTFGITFIVARRP